MFWVYKDGWDLILSQNQDPSLRFGTKYTSHQLCYFLISQGPLLSSLIPLCICGMGLQRIIIVIFLMSLKFFCKLLSLFNFGQKLYPPLVYIFINRMPTPVLDDVFLYQRLYLCAPIILYSKSLVALALYIYILLSEKSCLLDLLLVYSLSIALNLRDIDVMIILPDVFVSYVMLFFGDLSLLCST